MRSSRRRASCDVDRLGFALVVTVSLMILLALLAVGLLSLSTISLRSSGKATALQDARANARVALIIALADLQKTLGPDQRISARAGTLAQHPSLGAKLPTNSPRFWWVGAACSDPGKGVSSGQKADPNNPAVKWLISGVKTGQDPGQQINSPDPFDRPVPMYDKHSIDTATFTGGKPIEAGIVTIEDHNQRPAGGFAYFIDDDGMKAQLVATDPGVRNDAKVPTGGGVLPGSYDLGILQDMKDFKGVPLEDYQKLLSLNDLPLIAGDGRISRNKRLGYTTLSRGVLSDVRKGGLKRDLTIAFERDNVFDAVFPKGRGGSFASSYVVMDAEKFNQSADLRQNGYIHWETFKDYYNIKRSIKTTGGRTGTAYLDTLLINKSGILNGGGGTPFGSGSLGPHNIGPNPSVPSQHQALPYGDYSVMTQGKNSENFKHSPVLPILQCYQLNGWLEHVKGAGRQPDQIKTRVQMWTSIYNAHNIAIQSLGEASNAGPRLINYPQVEFDAPSLQIRNSSGGSPQPMTDIDGLAGKRESHVPYEVMLQPGRAHVFGFEKDGDLNSAVDRGIYGDKVKDLTIESVNQGFELVSGGRGGGVNVHFYLQYPSMTQGTDHLGGSHEISQVFWAPFAWEEVNTRIGRRPGRTISLTKSSLNELNENNMASFAFKLRSTREGRGALRPLVDANIRAMLCNTKWDSPLGVDVLAAYTPANRGQISEPIPQMATSDAPKGYTYWGGGDNPFDGYDRVILFDIPRQDLVSLGQLQHAGAGRFSYEPTYIVGNSYANLRIPLVDWRASISDSFSTAPRGLANVAIPGRFNLYDASYLVNEELWDSYIFTTIPQVRDNFSGPDVDPNDAYFKAVLAGDAKLPNPRFLPYEPAGSKFDRSTLQMIRGSGGQSGAFYHNAGHLLVDGAFNVNSISVDAWEAFLSGTHGLPYEKLTPEGTVKGFSTDIKGVRFPRVRSTLGGPMETRKLDENYWIGFRSLNNEEVRQLAEAIVGEIKSRGPFLTLGEFVNRKLQSGELGQRGALQAALDATVNKGLDSSFEAAATAPGVPDNSSQGAGFPGQLLQGDLLQALSPYMTVRSDSFTIRAYGESRDPATGKTLARAWCEAKVQRYPDPVPAKNAPTDALADLVAPASAFGRNFKILSFRWLSPSEI